MAKILEVSRQELIKEMKLNPGEQANNSLKALGEDSVYFAPMKISGNNYIWTHTTANWTKLGNASPSQRAKVESELESLRQRVSSKLASHPSLANELLSLPTDTEKYIFFLDDASGFRILLTGWGFKNAKQSEYIPGRKVFEKEVIESVSIGFTIAGELQPNREFAIQTVTGKMKPCITGNDGLYKVGELKKDFKLTLCDLPSGKKFDFNVEEKCTEYLFDVTQTMNISVIVKRDGAPEPNAEVQIQYHTKTHNIQTNANGLGAISVPYFAGETVVANFEDESAFGMATLPGINLELEAVTKVVTPPEGEKAPPPVATKARPYIKCTNQYDEICKDYPLQVEVNGKLIPVVTDFNGVVQLPEMDKDTVVVINDGMHQNPSQRYLADPDFPEMIYMIEEEDAAVDERTTTLRLLDIVGKPMANSQFTLTQNGRDINLITDNNGIATFDASEMTDGVEVTARIFANGLEDYRISFVYEQDENSYELQELPSKPKSTFWQRFANGVMLLAGVSAFIWLGSWFIDYFVN